MRLRQKTSLVGSRGMGRLARIVVNGEHKKVSGASQPAPLFGDSEEIGRRQYHEEHLRGHRRGYSGLSAARQYIWGCGSPGACLQATAFMTSPFPLEPPESKS